jgi:DNA-binding transcriptional ArsR family regulator
MFRRLVEAGREGLPSSEIAQAVGISPTSASFHLKELERAGLAIRTRSGRFVRYAVEIAGVSALIQFLTRDCCQRRPELCGPNFDGSGLYNCKGEQP